jgi:rRNA processing protein Gar1
MELAGLGSIQPYASQGYMSNAAYTTYALYLRSARWNVVVIEARRYEVGFLPLVLGSFEPLAPESYVAHQRAKGTKEKRQTEGDEEYSERKDKNRRDAAPFISPNRRPCSTT